MSSILDTVKTSVAAATTAATDFFAPAAQNTPLKMKSPDVTAYEALPSAQSDLKKPAEAISLRKNGHQSYNTFGK